MRLFSQLFEQLDRTTKTSVRIDALVRYFEKAAPEDKLWAVALFSGRRPKRPANTTRLREWSAALADIPQWLFDESYHVVGDLSETISLVVPQTATGTEKPLAEWMRWLNDLREKPEEEQKLQLQNAWSSLARHELFVFNKLMAGSFRIGVSQKMMVKALARHLDKDENSIAHRLTGQWDPFHVTWDELLLEESRKDDDSRPYPFFLAYALEENPEKLGSPEDWQAEWKWDGIRGQIIVRNDQLFVWTRGEELVTEKYPEYHPLALLLPNGTVIDGEILAYRDHHPLHFSVLQTRIGRKALSRKLLEKAPVVLMAYDLLEWNGQDLRDKPLRERRQLLENLVAKTNYEHFILSPEVNFHTWEELAAKREGAREKGSEGIMLKRKSSGYQTGRKRGDWWKWKIDPLTVDAVLIYAMRGHGRRANLYTDYTFAVWNEGELVPFAKAYSGLTDAEFHSVDAFVKRNTVERFGPVRSVKPELVFELAFEGIAASARHKSGVALRFPRMKRWRKDKPIEEANTLQDLLLLLKVYGKD